MTLTELLKATDPSARIVSAQREQLMRSRQGAFVTMPVMPVPEDKRMIRLATYHDPRAARSAPAAPKAAKIKGSDAAALKAAMTRHNERARKAERDAAFLARWDEVHAIRRAMGIEGRTSTNSGPRFVLDLVVNGAHS